MVTNIPIIIAIPKSVLLYGYANLKVVLSLGTLWETKNPKRLRVDSKASDRIAITGHICRKCCALDQMLFICKKRRFIVLHFLKPKH